MDVVHDYLALTLRRAEVAQAEFQSKFARDPAAAIRWHGEEIVQTTHLARLVVTLQSYFHGRSLPECRAHLIKLRADLVEQRVRAPVPCSTGGYHRLDMVYESQAQREFIDVVDTLLALLEPA